MEAPERNFKRDFGQEFEEDPTFIIHNEMRLRATVRRGITLHSSTNFTSLHAINSPQRNSPSSSIASYNLNKVIKMSWNATAKGSLGDGLEFRFCFACWRMTSTNVRRVYGYSQNDVTATDNCRLTSTPSPENATPAGHSAPGEDQSPHRTFYSHIILLLG